MEGLTGLRGLAALWVIGFHYTVGPLSPISPQHGVPLLRSGYLGVDLFFFLSGFVIWHVHEAHFRQPSVGAFRRFLGQRFARLYPVYAFTMALFVVIVLVGPLIGDTGLSARNYLPGQFVVDLLLVQSWGVSGHLNWNYPAWSVSAEMFCYLLFPLAVPLLGRLGTRAAAVAAALILLSIAGLYFFVYGATMNEALGAPALSRALLEFLEGCLLRRLAGEASISRIPWGLPIIALLLATGVAFACRSPLSGFLPILVFPALILAASRSDGLIGRIVAMKPLVAIGAASYSLYLLQAPVEKGAQFLHVYVASSQPLSSAMAICAYAAILILLTILVHRFLEMPARRVLRRRLA